MDSLTQQLETLGFGKTEADVYLALLQHNSLNGYQIAKLMDLSRSSVYAALASLSHKSVIHLIPGETNEYKAEAPEVLFATLKARYADCADRTLAALKDIESKEPEARFFNIEGLPNLLAKSQYFIGQAREEVCLNTSLDLDLLRGALLTQARKGVRIVVVSAHDVADEDGAIEVHHLSTEHCAGNERIMLVADDRRALVAGNRHGGKLIGTFTENPVFVQIVAEHINHDIYLSKLRQRLNTAKVVSEADRSWTLSEKRFHDELARLRQNPRRKD